MVEKMMRKREPSAFAFPVLRTASILLFVSAIALLLAGCVSQGELDTQQPHDPTGNPPSRSIIVGLANQAVSGDDYKIGSDATPKALAKFDFMSAAYVYQRYLPTPPRPKDYPTLGSSCDSFYWDQDESSANCNNFSMPAQYAQQFRGSVYYHPNATPS